MSLRENGPEPGVLHADLDRRGTRDLSEPAAQTAKEIAQQEAKGVHRQHRTVSITESDGIR